MTTADRENAIPKSNDPRLKEYSQVLGSVLAWPPGGRVGTRWVRCEEREKGGARDKERNWKEVGTKEKDRRREGGGNE